ncbi:hypothetical protein PVL29_005313 [Vitis rotundifolia]|uniref:WAT1-related protein n=1 Tax=Vitis rotundifolia TaxID=103349 RepID=A0AA39E298_VITRO|nr:hypothetical protein PVL29_005313 [Vitis rotundifolia]
MAGTFSNLLEGLKPVMVMVIIQIAFGGINIFYKLATNDGMSVKITVAYRMMFAAASKMLPDIPELPSSLREIDAHYCTKLEMKSRPKLTRRIFFLSFFLGIFGGSLSHNLYAESLALTSATYIAAMTNLIPAMTFVIGIILRMESLAIRTNVGKAKVVDTILSIRGAMILTFYKGVEMEHMAKLSMVYPSYSATALMSVCASIQSVVYALCTERDWSAWKLGWNIRLVTVVYTVRSFLQILLIFSWCVRKRGPLFVSTFNPLMLVFVAILGSLILDEKLHLGRSPLRSPFYL